MFRKIASFLFAASLSLMAESIVKNGFFDERPPEKEAMPPSWTMEKPAAGGWAFEDADGVDSATSISFTVTKGSGALTQKITLQPNTEYVLMIWVKSDGPNPVISLYDSTGKKWFGHSIQGKSTGWRSKNTGFLSGAGTDYVLALSGEGDGKIFYDSIEILTRADATKRQQQMPARTNRNIALHKKYTMPKAPDYALCKDEGDAVQLTDGINTVGYFWTQKTTVGWHQNKPVTVIVDLEKTEPICGASWSCAAGTAGVRWPSAIWVFASDDMNNWQFLGDLAYLGVRGKKAPDNSKYSTFKYETTNFMAKGRYVAFLLTDRYGIFCDEVEVLRGRDDFLNTPQKNEIAAKNGDFTEFLGKARGAAMVKKRLSMDMDAIGNSMKDDFNSFAEADKEKLMALLMECHRGFNAFSMTDDLATKSSEQPFDNYHVSAKIYSLTAFAQRAKGFIQPFVWKTNRWRNVTLIGNAPDDKSDVALSVTMMRGEVRSDAFSIANPTDNPQEFTIDVSAVNPALGMKALQAVVTDTAEGNTISSALRELPIADGKAKVTVPAGCNVQVWLMCYKPTAQAGKYSADVKIVGAKNPSVKLDVEIVGIDFPKRPQLSVGGWEYAGTYNAKNRLENIAFMREIGVNSTWAMTNVMPMNPKFDAEGHLSNAAELDFSKFDAWIKDWPGAHYYCLAHFMSRSEFFGEKANTPRYENMVMDYYKALEGRMSHLKLKPEQLVYLYLDEPSRQEQDKIIVDFLRIMKKANLKMQFFQDPTWPYPEKGLPEAFSLADILCPNTPMMTSYGQKFKDFYNKQREDGRTLWLYSCSGPAKQLDPLHYWRGQAWQCHQMKAVGSFFWAFGDTAGNGDSWNIYVQNGTEFSPYFVSREGAPTDSKQGEAIRESVADFEYMKMLEAEIARVKAANPNHPALAEAEKALAEAPAEVVSAISQGTFHWNTEKDYGLLDRNAVRLLKALAALRE
ncbi:MAG: hypothetical protein J5833_04350 [Victivallales bacterium]|nr:hypothetical protein [Victivallales bacterium]